ncbi:MAG: NUDIX domain-containing protein [Acidimicrobiales bacterium]
MTRTSAGLLVYRCSGDGLQVLLVHPGGPLWAKRDEGAWSVPKGEVDEGDRPEATAAREFEEELGHSPPRGEWIDLGEVMQTRKRVLAWAVEGDLDAENVRSNTFEMQWPPRSGHRVQFPEVDRAAWFEPESAIGKLVPAQRAFIARLVAHFDATR